MFAVKPVLLPRPARIGIQPGFDPIGQSSATGRPLGLRVSTKAALIQPTLASHWKSVLPLQKKGGGSNLL